MSKYLFQYGSDYEIYAKVISPLKHGGNKIKQVTVRHGRIPSRAITATDNGWYPAPIEIPASQISEKIIKLLEEN
jgi:hypothetical protein